MISKKTTDFWKAIAIIIVAASHYFGWLVGEEHFLSTIGPFGVDIFFLLSGYGLVCSASKNGIDLQFVLKRFCSVYLPYLLVAGAINLIYDDLSQTTVKYWINYFTGYDYWFMNILFVLYLAFMVIYKVCRKDFPRLILLTAVVLLYSVRLYMLGRADFWTLSNAAFLFGVYGATLEKTMPHLLNYKRSAGVLLILSGAGAIWLCLALQKIRLTDKELAYSYELYCNLLFSAAVLFLLYLLPLQDYALCFLGKYTLYIYLTHSVIFWRIYPYLPENMHIVLRTLISFGATCLLSAAVGSLYQVLSSTVRKVIQKNVSKTVLQ